jgi:hypothetical protein
MKVQSLATSLIILTFTVFDSFESPAQINGRVTDISKNAIPFCNVLLTKVSDTTLVTGSTTDTSGNFQLEIKDTGNFRIVVGYIGYNKFYSQPFSIPKSTSQYNSGTISLEPDAHVLKGVQVVAEKPFIEHRIDRTVFNIENSIISAGNDALEVLGKLPGVTVNSDDAIKVRGKPGVLILMDGRTLYMSAADAGNYLKSLDASQIEKIEVITNPSAKYDASGNAVINIILKKNKNLGFNGQVNASHAQGFYGTSFGGLNANYRMKKFNFFGNCSGFDNKMYLQKGRESTFSAGGEPYSIFNDQIHRVFEGNGGNGRIGIDFTPNDKQTIGVVAEGYTNIRTQTIVDNTLMYNASSVLDSSFKVDGTGRQGAKGNTYNLNYKFKMDSLGRELSANADYSTFSFTSENQYVTNYYDNNYQSMYAPNTLKNELLGTIHVAAAKVDYVQPLGKKGKLETGLKSSILDADNDGHYWNVRNGSDVTDTTKTNHFIYSENINAGYFNLSHTFSKKLEAQIGLRGEQTRSTGTQEVNDSTVKRNYINLFPSAFVNWKLDTNHTLNFSYSRRIDRPDYEMINPFLFFSNQYNYDQGNPYLKPQLSDNFELNHVFKDFLSTSFGYLHMTNVFSETIFQNYNTQIVYRTPENMAHYNCYNILINVTLHPAKWWTCILSANIFHDHYFGAIPGGTYNKTYVTGEFYTLNSFSLKHNWSIELFGYYRTINIYGLLVEKVKYRGNIGIKKRFANDKGTLALNLQDALWSEQTHQTENIENVNYLYTDYRDSRRLNLSISWKLGRSQYRREDRGKSASEEINRVNKGQ